MATSSQSPKLSDGWIPYLALAFFSTVIVAELLMDSFTAGGKYQVRNLVGFVFLGLLAYFFSKTETTFFNFSDLDFAFDVGFSSASV